MIIGRRRKRGNGGNELKDTFSGNVCECKKLMSSMAWEWDGEVGAVRAGARANEAFRKVGEEEEKEKEEEEERGETFLSVLYGNVEEEKVGCCWWQRLMFSTLLESDSRRL